MVTDNNGDVWLTPQEAADRLGLTIGTIYHLRKHITHRKGKSRVFFLERTLFEDYINL
jgi:hypothetical protein